MPKIIVNSTPIIVLTLLLFARNLIIQNGKGIILMYKRRQKLVKKPLDLKRPTHLRVMQSGSDREGIFYINLVLEAFVMEQAGLDLLSTRKVSQPLLWNFFDAQGRMWKLAALQHAACVTSRGRIFPARFETDIERLM